MPLLKMKYMDQIQKFKNRLKELGACKDARIWAEGKPAAEAWNQCHRADWLLWWGFQEKHDIRSFTLAKARCAKLILHLMTDPRSVNAVHVAEQFGLGLATEEELMNAAYAAHGAVHAAYVAAYVAAANAAYAVACPYYYGADIPTDDTQAKCVEIIRETIKPNFI